MPRQQLSRTELLDVASRLLARRRLGDVSMDELAAAAGVSKGLLYLRFADRDALFRALVDREFRETLVAIRDAVNADERGGLLSRVYLHTIAALRERPLLFGLYTGQADDLAALVRLSPPERYLPRIEAGRRYLARLLDEGVIRTDLDGRLGAVLGAVAIGLAAGAEVVDVEEVVAGTAALLAAGVDAQSPADVTAGKAAFAELADELLALVPDPAEAPMRSGS